MRLHVLICNGNIFIHKIKITEIKFKKKAILITDFYLFFRLSKNITKMIFYSSFKPIKILLEFSFEQTYAVLYIILWSKNY